MRRDLLRARVISVLLPILLFTGVLLGVGPGGCTPASVKENGTVTAIFNYNNDIYYGMADAASATKRIKRVAIGSAIPRPLQPLSGVTSLDGIKVDAAGIFFTATLSASNKPGLYWAPMGGGSSSMRFEGSSNDRIVDFELASNPVYFIHHEALGGGAMRSSIKRVNKVGGGLKPVAAAEGTNDINELAIEGNYLYYSSCSGGTIRRVDRSNNANNYEVLRNRGCVTNLASDGDATTPGNYLFWMERRTGAVYRSDVTGEHVTQLYLGNSMNHKIVVPGLVDSENYYWASEEDANIDDDLPGMMTVRKVSRVTGKVTVLSDELPFTAWTQDADFIYVGKNKGIWKIPKTITPTEWFPRMVVDVVRDPENLNMGDASMSGPLIVWTDYWAGNADVYLIDLEDPAAGFQRITTNARDQVQPVISGNRIVWTDFRSGATVPNTVSSYDPSGIADSDLYFCDYNRSTNSCSEQTPVPIAENARPETQRSPSLSGNLLVYEDARSRGPAPLFAQLTNIYLYDWNTNRETRLTSDDSAPWTPKISGNRVVWSDTRFPIHYGDLPNDWRVHGEIYTCVYNPASATNPCPEEAITRPVSLPVTPDMAVSRWDPNISGNKIIWLQKTGPTRSAFDDTRVYLYNALTRAAPRQISSNTVYNLSPQISRNLVIWTDFRRWSSGGGFDIYAYNIATGREYAVSSAPGWELGLATNGSDVVSFDNRRAAGNFWAPHLLSSNRRAS